jgi:hypothetical protein
MLEQSPQERFWIEDKKKYELNNTYNNISKDKKKYELIIVNNNSNQNQKNMN